MYSLQNPLIRSAAFVCLGKQVLRMSWRYAIHTKARPLQYVPHAYSFDDAIKRLVEYDKQRLFARKYDTSSALVSSSPSDSPLKKVLIPTFDIQASVSSAKYFGMYGRYRTVTHTDAKGHTYSYITTDWFPTFGELGPTIYTSNNLSNSIIYAGSRYHDNTTENAFRGKRYEERLRDFEQDAISQEILIDPFDKKDAYAQPIAQNRIYDAECERARDDIMRWHASPLAMITSLSYEANIKMDKALLPAYIVQRPNTPIQILAAISNNDTTVHGIAAVSEIKVMSTVTALSALLTYMMPPQISLPARAFGVIFSTLMSGVYSRYRLDIHHSLQTDRIEYLREKNEEVSATFADKERLAATSRDAMDYSQNAFSLDIENHAFEVLGIDRTKPIDEHDVLQAAQQKLHRVHPDKGGSVSETIEVLNARQTILTALHLKKTSRLNQIHRRNFSTKAKLPPRSIYYPRTNELIEAVFSEDYQRAIALVQNGDAHPDGHDKNENTLLTEAVKREDYNAAAFALRELQCSPDASCDCPLHNTALHYAAAAASESDNAEQAIAVIKLLIEHGARINLINTKGYTPLDMAKNPAIKTLLVSQGGITHANQKEGGSPINYLRRIFGYSPEERTLLETSTPLNSKVNNNKSRMTS